MNVTVSVGTDVHSGHVSTCWMDQSLLNHVLILVFDDLKVGQMISLVRLVDDFLFKMIFWIIFNASIDGIFSRVLDHVSSDIDVHKLI